MVNSPLSLNGEKTLYSLHIEVFAPIDHFKNNSSVNRGGILVAGRELAPKLYNLGKLTEVDVDMLALYCQVWQRYQTALNIVAEQGSVFETDKGYQQIHPCMTIVNQCLSHLDKISKQFGMSPMSRQRIEVYKKSDKPNEFSEI